MIIYLFKEQQGILIKLIDLYTRMTGLEGNITKMDEIIKM